MTVVHVYPENDLQEHVIDGEAGAKGECSCKPRMQVFENGNVLFVHNSFDGREILEQLEARKEAYIQ